MKMYNVGNGVGDQLHVPTTKKRGDDGVVREFVKVPVIFGEGKLVEHKPGNVYLPIDGVGFFTIPRDGFLDIPPGVSEAAVKGLAPHLVSEDEYLMSSQPEAPAEPVAESNDPEPARRGRPPKLSQ